MKLILLILLVFSSNSVFAEINVESILGINGVSNVNYGITSLTIILDSNDTSDLEFTFYSSSTQPAVLSVPKIETIGDSYGVVNIVSTSVPVATAGPNQMVTLRISKAHICEVFNNDMGNSTCASLAGDLQTFRIGFDGASDGLTVGTGDDSLTFTIEIK